MLGESREAILTARHVQFCRIPCMPIVALSTELFGLACIHISWSWISVNCSYHMLVSSLLWVCSSNNKLCILFKTQSCTRSIWPRSLTRLGIQPWDLGLHKDFKLDHCGDSADINLLSQGGIKSQSKLIFKVPTTTSGVPSSHILQN